MIVYIPCVFFLSELKINRILGLNFFHITNFRCHSFYAGDMTIGSSTDCGVSLNGSGVQSLHCTLYRSESNEVTLVPEKNSRILIDGKKIDGEATLTQGAMITVGKSNYLRFNNPAEAQMIRSTIGSNERISMPQIDFTHDSSSNEVTLEDVFENSGDILEGQIETSATAIKKQQQRNSKSDTNCLQNLSKIEYAIMNNSHSPKVFTADSITVNTPAKDVLGPKFTNFTKNFTQIFSKNEKNCEIDIVNKCQSQNNYVAASTTAGKSNSAMTNEVETTPVLSKVNNAVANGGSPSVNNATSTPKLQPASACYDRYPKPGSYGSLQVYPMNCVNNEINNAAKGFSAELQRHRAQLERMHEQEMSKVEQDRLEEIMRMCADFERYNQSIQSSPIVQNRIKTNGSLPRERKSPFIVDSPVQSRVFFSSSSPSEQMALEVSSGSRSNGYENVKMVSGHCVDILSSSASSVWDPTQNLCSTSSSSPASDKVSHGYENVLATRKISGYVPQSPRTKIKTCISPKKEPLSPRKAEYDLLVQSFEEKLRLEFKQLSEQRLVDSKKAAQTNGKSAPQSPNPRSMNTNTSTPKENVYGTISMRNRNVNNLTVNIKKNLDEQQIAQLKKQRIETLQKIRELKTEIAELQQQEEEVLREVGRTLWHVFIYYIVIGIFSAVIYWPLFEGRNDFLQILKFGDHFQN